MDTEKGHLKKESRRARDRKKAALFALTIQSSLLILTMRLSRMQSEYSASTAVMFSELLKLAICFVQSTRIEGFKSTLNHIYSRESYKLAIPASLYVFQNYLQFFAASRLDAGTLQATYQLKILTTAVFSVWFLKRSLKAIQWGCLLMLAFGVGVMQLDKRQETETKSQISGLCAVLAVCVFSGAAGVYFEKIVKSSGQQVTVWAHNMQLGVYSLIPVILMLVNDREIILDQGVLLHGYTLATYAVIVLQAAGGILVANVVKHADSILKNFATSISIIISTCISYALWGTPITWLSALGALLVIVSTCAFSEL